MDCSICFESVQASCEFETSCRHIFHKSCMSEWIVQCDKNTCPMCRRVIFNDHVSINGLDIPLRNTFQIHLCSIQMMIQQRLYDFKDEKCAKINGVTPVDILRDLIKVIDLMIV